MDKMREEFEAWLESNGQLTLKEDDGEYSFQHTRLAFEAWKASRAALCVELPVKINDDNDTYSYGYDSAITDVEVALEKLGVSHI